MQESGSGRRCRRVGCQRQRDTGVLKRARPWRLAYCLSRWAVGVTAGRTTIKRSVKATQWQGGAGGALAPNVRLGREVLTSLGRPSPASAANGALAAAGIADTSNTRVSRVLSVSKPSLWRIA